MCFLKICKYYESKTSCFSRSLHCASKTNSVCSVQRDEVAQMYRMIIQGLQERFDIVQRETHGVV